MTHKKDIIEFNHLKKEVKMLERFFIPHEKPFVSWLEKEKKYIIINNKRIYYTFIKEIIEN